MTKKLCKKKKISTQISPKLSHKIFYCIKTKWIKVTRAQERGLIWKSLEENFYRTEAQSSRDNCVINFNLLHKIAKLTTIYSRSSTLSSSFTLNSIELWIQRVHSLVDNPPHYIQLCLNVLEIATNLYKYKNKISLKFPQLRITLISNL